MKISDFFSTMNLKKQDLYNARAALRSYLQWSESKLARKASDTLTLESFSILDIPISAAQINAFATNGPTSRNHAVLLRRLLEAQNSLQEDQRKVPAYVVHAEKLKQLDMTLFEKGLSKSDFASSAGIRPRELAQIYSQWACLNFEAARKMDAYLLSIGSNLRFSDNIAPTLLYPPCEKHRISTNRATVQLPVALETFIANVRDFYLSPRTSYDGCDTGRPPCPSTVHKLCYDLRSFFLFLCYDLQWFYDRYRSEFNSEFKAIEMPKILNDEWTFRLLFRPDLVKLYVRYYLPLKSAIESGDLSMFKEGKNTETSPKWVQSVRPLFNKSGYIFLGNRSQRIQGELGLAVSDITNWKAECMDIWSAYGEIDKVCRDNAVASRPRTPKKSTDDQGKAILNAVLDMPVPSQVLNLFHREIKGYLYDLDPSTDLYREIEEVLFISYFLTAIPLRVSNLTALTVACRRNELDKRSGYAVISWDAIKKCAKIFIHAELVKNGKRLGAIDRSVPGDLLSLIEHRFGKLDGLSPRKIVSLSAAQINNYLNKLSYTFLRDYFPKGLTVHCYRHIVASTVIKEDPAGHIVAAQLLHDDFNQIVKTYGYMKQDEHVARYYSKGAFKGVYSDFLNKDSSGSPLGNPIHEQLKA